MMIKNQLLFFVLILFCFSAKGDNIQGIIYDKKTGHPIEGATVQVGLRGVASDAGGFFDLNYYSTSAVLEVSHTAYENYRQSISSGVDTFLHIFMNSKVNNIEEVSITGNSSSFIENTVPGMLILKQSDITSQASLMGMPDVIATLQKGVGVQSVSEGVAGIYVRGGDAGQNLILYDNIELVDPSHLLGSFSAFNPYLVESVEFYKGNSPVQYAGRLSSSIVVQSYDDVEDKPNVTASLGTLASTIALSYQKNNWGIVLGVRRTQLELYKEAAMVAIPQSKGFLASNNYSFYDCNGKLFYNNRKNDRLSLSWYVGGDDLVYEGIQNSNIGMGWSNKGAAFNWKHTQADHAYNTVVGITNYQFDFNGELLGYNAHFLSDYTTTYLKHTFTKQWGDHVTTVDAKLYYNHVMPQNTSYGSSTLQHDAYDVFKSTEATLAFADKWDISEKFSIYAGLRFMNYTQLGPQNYTTVDNGDTTRLSYSKNSTVENYFTVLPNLYLNWKKSSSLAYKLAYSLNAQNVHRANLSTLPLPADMWITSTKYLKPEFAHLLSFGVFKTHGDYDFSAEVYGKYYENILSYEINMSGELSDNFEDNFRSGEGCSVGLELYAKKNVGKLNGWIAYTLAKTRHHTTGVNNNQWYDAKYDRIHDLSVVMNYKLTPRLDLTSSFTLASGNKATVPSGRYFMMGYLMNDYDGINQFRMPLYHRLDVGLNYHLEPKFFEESVLNFSVINLYNRQNTYFFFYELRGDLESQELAVTTSQFSLFPVLPSISWMFKF